MDADVAVETRVMVETAPSLPVVTSVEVMVEVAELASELKLEVMELADEAKLFAPAATESVL